MSDARAAARAAGEKHYHGRACKRGHTWRLVSTDRCIDCGKRVRKYEAHPRDSARAVARASGEKFYHGPPCVHGHSGERYTANALCVECGRAKALEQEAAGETAHNEARRENAFLAEWYPEEFDRAGWRRGKVMEWQDVEDMVWG